MKRYFGVFVILLAVATSAFTFNNKASKVVGNSYTYDLYGQPGQDDIANINDPANYSYAGTGALTCPTGSAHRCGVENATDDGFGHPDFSQSFLAKSRN